MGLKTYEGKTLLQVEFLTNWKEDEALRSFRRWIDMAPRCSIEVTILIEPEFTEKDKENVKED